MKLKDVIKNRVLIFGANGMLGHRLVKKISSENLEIFLSSLEDSSFNDNINFKKCDITNRNDVKNLIYDFCPDYIVNLAAFTNVDKAESEKETAWKVNVKAVEYISEAARVLDSHIIHISSDYIFDGINGPYLETSIPNPIGYYGRTKLASENVLKLYAVKHTIIRTNVLYGPTNSARPDFVRWTIENLKNKNPIRIVTDQINNPTFTDDLAEAIIQIIKLNKSGIYNIGGRDFLSRFDFTIMIADFFKLDKNLIIPILTKDLNQPARRPLKSGLITIKAQSEFAYRARSIKETFEIISNQINL